MSRRRTLATTLALIALLATSMVAPAAAAQELTYGDERGDLEIREESWLEDDESIAVDRTGNRTIYDVDGPRYEVTLTNTDHANVTNYGVADGEATVEYDEQRNVYVVEPAGEGTVGLYWNTNDGNSTTRYAASLRASNVEWEHHQPAELESTRNDAQNWSEASSAAREVNPTQPPGETISEGLTYAEFFASPFQTFRQDIQATIVMLTLRPGGLVVLATFLLISALGVAVGYRRKHKTDQQFEQFDDLQTERDRAWLEKAKRIFQQNDMTDLYPDHISRAMTKLFGPNTWIAHKNYLLMRSPTHTKGLVLSMMSQIGYVGIVDRDDDGEVQEVRAVHASILDHCDDPLEAPAGPDEVPLRDITTANAPKLPGGEVAADGGDPVETVDLATLRYDDRADRALISAVPGEHLDMRVFQDSVSIDADDVSLPIDNHDISDAELISEINPNIPGDFESEEQYAEVLGELLEFVCNHPLYTDAEGNVREEMDLLSFMCEMDSVMADKADFPVADTQRKALYWIAEELDPNSKLRDEMAERKGNGGRQRSDNSAESVIDESDIDGLDGGVSIGFDDPTGGASS
ncbi:hypothetical protein HTZ84_22545 [Haloterrigena sp. SYSU A558-1]|uniref:Uncharacterized protein n=1 Tax=Haloterrigena gelatinilytica TaxID=2741724 RepID=A0ABX2LKV0_9EURY|nr:hypothetical protein [Haloterrigena gelatinilytica]NUC75048.1 hypothetical protein [Haloterrigena gelatinilytica]